MNKTYKTVWSHVRHAFMAVAEHARGGRVSKSEGGEEGALPESLLEAQSQAFFRQKASGSSAPLKSLPLSAVPALVLFFCCSPLWAVDYVVDVGAAAEGATFKTLEDLRLANVLQDGDKLILRNNDSTLTGTLTDKAITFTGQGQITPGSTGYNVLNSPSNTATTLGRYFSDALHFSGFQMIDETDGGVINTGDLVIKSGVQTFLNNSATSTYSYVFGGAIRSSLSVTFGDGTQTFDGNQANGKRGAYGGAINAQIGVAFEGGSQSFRNNEATAIEGVAGGGAVSGGSSTFKAGSQIFIDNKATAGNGDALGGALNTLATFTGGTQDFHNNKAMASNGNAYGGAIYGYGGKITFAGGEQTFSNNSATSSNGSTYGGAIYTSSSLVTFIGGTQAFSGNMADKGGAIYHDAQRWFADDAFVSLTINGGKQSFTDNIARQQGGAIFIGGDGLLRARADDVSDSNSDSPSHHDHDEHCHDEHCHDNNVVGDGFNGDMLFRGNTSSGVANAIYLDNNKVTLYDENFDPVNRRDTHAQVVFAAEEGRSIFFYDPITSNAAFNDLQVVLHPEVTDTGSIVFDGSYWQSQGKTRALTPDFFTSYFYGSVRQEHGNTLLKGGAQWQVSDTLTIAGGSFLLADDSGVNAKKITISGGSLIVGEQAGSTANLRVAEGVSVGSGAILGGHGRIEGDVMLDGGALLPGNNSPGVLSISGQLSGAGEIYLDVLDFSKSANSNLLQVGSTAGHHQLQLGKVTGSTKGAGEFLKVIDVTGDASTNQGDFSLKNAKNGMLSRGAWQYELRKGDTFAAADDGEDWYLRNTGLLSNYAKDLQKMGSLQLILFEQSLNAVQKRMGELRFDEHTEGDLWLRAWHKQFDNRQYTSHTDHQRISGMELGGDKRFDLDATQRLYLGAFFALGKGDSPLHSGSKLKADHHQLGVYASWIHEKGSYLDVNGRYAWLDRDYRFATSDQGNEQVSSKGNQGYGLTLEAGQRLTLSERWSLEPQIELAWVQTKSEHLNTNHGTRIDFESGKRMTLRTGLGTAYHIKELKQQIQTFARLDYLSILQHEADVRLDGTRLDVKKDDGRWLFAGGVQWQRGDMQLHLGLETSLGGSDVKEKLGINGGVRWGF